MQTKRQSLMEVGVNVGVKFCTATALWMLVRPYAMDIPAVAVTCIFTLNSFVFSYIIRRCFNRGERL